MPVDAVSAYSTQTDLFGIISGKKSPGGQKQAPKVKPGSSADDLTPDQKREVEKLKQRDQEVRAHEQAHIAASGGYAKGGATFQYQKGPDGKMYAVGGEVSIDTSPVRNNPQATIAKMETVKAAALAPADPSGQDRAVAAAAEQTEAQARRDEADQQMAKAKGGGQPAAPGSKPESAPVLTYSADGTITLFAKATPPKLNLLS
jgi:hypothetical protein